MAHHTDSRDPTTTGTALRVVKWSEVFETWASRSHKTLTWISVPTGPHSSGYLHMIDTFGDRAASIYGAWIALVKIAAAAPTRGVLANGKGIPYTPGHLSRLSYFPASLFAELIDWATSPDVRWLEPIDADQIRDGPDQVEPWSKPPLDQVDDPPNHGRNAAPTPSTRPDQTRPNQTRPDQTRPSVSRSVVEESVRSLSRDDVERQVERFRRLSRMSTGQIPTTLAVAICCCDAAVRRGFASELAERLRHGSIRRIERYARSAIRTACSEAGVDVDHFRAAVSDWTTTHLPRRPPDDPTLHTPTHPDAVAPPR